MIIAPTEPPALRALGQVNLQPEVFGVDILFVGQGQMCGIQRKEIRDLIASVQDGRLAKEAQQMMKLGVAILIVEGDPQWSRDGQFIDRWTRWTKSQQRRLMASVMAKGIFVYETKSLDETVEVVLDMEAWAKKEAHLSLVKRGNPVGEWGKPNLREWQLWVLQGLPGVGPGLASKILDHFGKMPIAWGVTEAQLEEVAGLGKKRVKAIWEALDAIPPALVDAAPNGRDPLSALVNTTSPSK